MDATFPWTTALYAAILGLLGAALTVNVIIQPGQMPVDTGDGGIARSARRSAPRQTSSSRHRSR